MKNWILINDKKFEILCHQNSEDSKYVRAFRINYDGDITSFFKNYRVPKNNVKQSIRILIRFEDLELPIWNTNTKTDFFIKINRTHLSGNFVVHSIEGVSGFKDGRIVDLVVTDLNSNNAPLNEIREVQLSDLLS